MKKWEVAYVVGNTYKFKYVFAETNTQAIKKARVKNIIDLYVVDENNNRVEEQSEVLI